MAMSSPNTISSSVLELHGLGSRDPGLCTDLDVAAAAGSNCKKRKELEPAPHNADALDVSGIEVGDKLLAKGPASNGEHNPHPSPLHTLAYPVRAAGGGAACRADGHGGGGGAGTHGHTSSHIPTHPWRPTHLKLGARIWQVQPTDAVGAEAQQLRYAIATSMAKARVAAKLEAKRVTIQSFFASRVAVTSQQGSSQGSAGRLLC